MNFYSEKIQNFLSSVAKYLDNAVGTSFSWLFIIFMGLFALTTIIIIISSSSSYEYQLTRAIDKIDKFLSKNPRINDDNLITFNNKMKEKSIPKALRRQWQQFMLYREHEASYYMSFKHCVENPLKSSSFNQRLTIYKVVTMILIVLSILLGVFCSSYNSLSSLPSFFQDILIIPTFILVIYWVVSVILNLIHNATTGDLYQNYQYFEINIDKATTTLPEYVDYEVLFTQDEIRRGIPVLFEYIQKRAIEEQKELEKARIKNVEHEKYNFDEVGLDASLVLERSMQEAENYIATRKKFMQDIEQVNNEISALENQYKENVKENQKLMQTSKESIDGLKKQLEQATSSIEINYIKKQMKDEINRQQVAERDFDTMTDKFNKETKDLHQEVDNLQGEIDKAKKDLEESMMSEFSTYSGKVYEKLEKVAKDSGQEVINGYKKQINELEEKLALKDEELDNVYSQYQSQLSKLEERNKDFDNILREKDDMISQVQEQLEQGKTRKKKKYNQPVEEVEEQNFEENNQENFDFAENQEDSFADSLPEQNNFDELEQYLSNDNFAEQNDFSEESLNEIVDTSLNGGEDYNYLSDESAVERFENGLTEKDDNNLDFNYKDEPSEELTFNYTGEEQPQDAEKSVKEEEQPQNDASDISFDYLPKNEEKTKVDEKPVKEEKVEEPQEDDDDDTSRLFDEWLNEDEDEKNESDTDLFEEDNEEDKTESEKDTNLEEDDFGFEDEEAILEDEEEVIDEESKDEANEEESEDEELVEEDEDFAETEDSFVAEEKPVKRAGRPRKIVDESEIKPKRKPGRPRKVVPEKVESQAETVRRVGRPRKQVQVETPARRVGRPRKEVEEPVRRVGRPKKVEEQPVKRVGRPKKVETETVKKSVGRPSKAETEKKSVGRPKGSVVKKVGRPKKARPVGRPKKANPVGRPKKETTRKTSLNEIDKKLKELNDQIKRENKNFAKTKKQLEKVNIKKRKGRK